MHNLFDDALDMSSTCPLDLKRQQQADDTLQTVLQWLQGTQPGDLQYATFEVKKYAKQLPRLKLENNVIYRLFFSYSGQVQYKQYCLPKKLRHEVLYPLHNSATGGHRN